MSDRAERGARRPGTGGERRPRGCRRLVERSGAGERGQASIELLAMLPVLLLVALGAAQVLALGYSSVLAGNAAEAAALTLVAGGDPEAAARDALPGWSRRRLDVAVKGGEVRVRLRPPALIPRFAGELEVTATAAVEAP